MLLLQLFSNLRMISRLISKLIQLKPILYQMHLSQFQEKNQKKSKRMNLLNHNHQNKSHILQQIANIYQTNFLKMILLLIRELTLRTWLNMVMDSGLDFWQYIPKGYQMVKMHHGILYPDWQLMSLMIIFEWVTER